MLPWLIPAIAAGSSVVTQLLQNRSNKKMADYTYANDKAMFNATNEYNSPKNQMARYGQAGLNPNLIYSQGNSGNASSPPKYQTPERIIPKIDTMNIITEYQELKNKMKTEDLLDQQIENTKNEAYNRSLMPAILSLKPSLMSASVSETLQNIRNKEAQEKLLHFGLTKQEGLLPFQLNAMQLKNAKTSQELNKIMSEIGINEQTKKWLTLKYDTMKNTSINIDKDAAWMRILADVFGQPIIDIKNAIKGIYKNDIKTPPDRKPNNQMEQWLWRLGILHN
ncbi:MAG: DNA pilot protein [Microvirus sp.]|nr:MAG: DNA pilot protein [Microvirus sp.]